MPICEKYFLKKQGNPRCKGLINGMKEYSNGEVTITWEPEKCIHSGVCVKGLGDVFQPKEKPWITPENSTTEKIISTVDKCPSGALTYYLNKND